MQSLSVYNAADIHIVDGVNFGDTLSFADDLILDDAYMLPPMPLCITFAYYCLTQGCTSTNTVKQGRQPTKYL